MTTTFLIRPRSATRVASLVLASGALLSATPARAEERLLGLGNSQLFFCDGSLEVLESFSEEIGRPIETTLNTGSATFIAHGLPPSVGEYDYVLLTNQNRAWDDYPQPELYAAAEELHREIVRAGATTVLFMTYAIGATPDAGEGPRVEEFEGHWRALEEHLDALDVDGETHDVILVPVLPLWHAGKTEYPGGGGCDTQSFMADSLHGSRRAQFATGALLTSFLTCESTLETSFTGAVDEPFAAWAKEITDELLNSDYRPAHCADADESGTGTSSGTGMDPTAEGSGAGQGTDTSTGGSTLPPSDEGTGMGGSGSASASATETTPGESGASDGAAGGTSSGSGPSADDSGAGHEGGGCRVAGPSSGAPWSLLLLWLAARRRRHPAAPEAHP